MLKNIENQSSCLGPGSKRSADNMMQYVSTPVTSPSAETVVSDTQSDTENYASKRLRLNEERQAITTSADKPQPSRVIHVRNLPPDTSEGEIMQLAAGHGQVTNLILMRNKRQAFVEMHDVTQAISIVRYHQQQMVPAMIRGQPVQLQYSATYTELKPGQRSHSTGMKPTPVLHINIDNYIAPITLGLFYQMFSSFGTVQKIITFTKNNQFQALVQMSDVETAGNAKQHLDGKNVYPNCCVLRIDFSKMISINVKYNNDKSCDFTNPELPSGESGTAQTSPPPVGMINTVRPVGMCVPMAPTLNANPMMNAYSAVKGLGAYRMLTGVNPTALSGFGFHPTAPAVTSAAAIPAQAVQLGSPRLPLTQPLEHRLSPSQMQLQQLMINQIPATANPLNPHSLQIPALAAPAAAKLQVPNMLPHMIHNSVPTSVAHEMQMPCNAQQLVAQVPDQQQLMLHRMQLQQLLQQQYFNPPTAATPQQQYYNPPTTATPQHSQSNVSSTHDLRTPSPAGPVSPVILVSSFNSQKVSPDALFTLFGMYGDVVRVKILFHRPDTALVQYADPAASVSACKYLDKAVFWQNEIRVIMSKYSSIQMHSQDPSREGSKLTQDYTTSDMHRYRKQGSRNLSNIYPPSNTLHLSNLPGTVEETRVIGEFSNYGTVAAFKFFPKDRRMALIQMSNEPEAIEALIGMHNFQMSETHQMRVSFSKSPIQM